MHPVYTVSIRRSKRARRMSIRIHPGAQVELVLPLFVSDRKGEVFLEEKRNWIARAVQAQEHIAAVQKPVTVAHGLEIPCFGDTFILSIVIASDRKRSNVAIRESQLFVRVAQAENVQAALEAWYRNEALAYFTGQSHEYAQMLGVSIRTIRTISMKTQWGSCNAQRKALTFNWRLAFAPEEIARYVAAHEVSHLLRSSHSAAFWNTVKKISPDYKQHRAWLARYGGNLYIRA